jgi:ribosomal protein L7Ae-like RNA K-turn-binding protein
MSDEIDALAASWPRPLIAAGSSEAVARWWCESRVSAITAGEPPFARHRATPALCSALFEIRRARWLVRGLEEAAKALSAQHQGLKQAPAAQVEAGKRRISRLLVLSNDGSDRFYRDVEKLCRAHSVRLEAVVLECDEVELGEAIFGPGRAARAVLLDHKEAVVHFLETLEV